ncbi:hypothetical protein SAMN05216410_0222 [Sanguibacter gelidistatuariae]|uniref:Hemagglutinin n=1 Tax=Sanguibacter gelidistatuariae TaxID=1814289 RepID=A0A1G6XXP3_9MICO|nr:hypothetical protein [Sanguibacter gelidistatuariae]SDD82207.1 hypothetical protein SAMN05216410_0222 [Sanguibacter gelidistatuariae]
MITRTHIAVPLIVAMLLSVLVGFQVVTTASTAVAAPVTGFDPGLIISDAVMNESSTMSAGDIQSFLNTKGASCSAGAGYTCIKHYVETTPTRAADALCTGAYVGTANESAAAIIAKVSGACGINPQVLLVTLQKEQGLVTATAGKTAATYSRALGFGCPDNAGGACDPSYAGFANQVYSAAKQLKRYAANPTSYSYRAGRTNTVLWHPNTTCGSSQVYIQNQATASLYNYTPYRPNAAALAAGYGTGDSCSSYGNRNFHLYFTEWFGSSVQRTPFGVVDSVSSASGVGSIRVRGWALDPDTSASINVHVYVDGKVATASLADGSRPDVASVYGNGAAHGFDVNIPSSGGTHSVCVYAIDSSKGANTYLGCSTVTVTNQAPRGTFDNATPTPGAVQVRGWALDPDTTAPISVHIYVDGKMSRATVSDSPRADIGRAFGLGDNHGFDTLVPVSNGSHTVCVYAIDASGGSNPLVGCRVVTVINVAPTGSFDSLVSTGPGTMQVRGWAFDRDTTDPISVHVYVDGKVAKGVTANTSRPDVARVHAVSETHGFDTSLATIAGAHTVCVYAIDSSGGSNPNLGCRTVTVENSVTSGSVDQVSGNLATAGGGGKPSTSASVTATGWAWDLDSDAPVFVELLLDQAVIASGTASVRRTDVGGISRTDVGFSLTAPAVPGSHEVCIRATDPTTKERVNLGCKTVVVPNTAANGVIDEASASSGTINVRGWAHDLDTTSPVAVHVYLDGAHVASLLANGDRPDIDNTFGTGRQHGFATSIPAQPGTHTVRVYAIGWPAGSGNPIIESRTVTVN